MLTLLRGKRRRGGGVGGREERRELSRDGARGVASTPALTFCRAAEEAAFFSPILLLPFHRPSELRDRRCGLCQGAASGLEAPARGLCLPRPPVVLFFFDAEVVLFFFFFFFCFLFRVLYFVLLLLHRKRKLRERRTSEERLVAGGEGRRGHRREEVEAVVIVVEFFFGGGQSNSVRLRSMPNLDFLISRESSLQSTHPEGGSSPRRDALAKRGANRGAMEE